MQDVLPICHAREIRGRIYVNGKSMIPCHCMSCGKHKGLMPEPTAGSGYVGYLCDDCAPKYSAEVGMRLVPDEVHARQAEAEMLSRFGRMLSSTELLRQLESATTPLAALARDAERAMRQRG